MTKVEIDATNETLGRLASKIAVLLRGKNLASYQPEVQPQIEVMIKNADKVRFTGSKLANKTYYHYSGYHSGIRARKFIRALGNKTDSCYKRMRLSNASQE